MDFSFSDVQMNDPFLSLETNLDDISAVIQMDSQESFGMPSSSTAPWQQPSSSIHNPYSRPNQHSPPQEYYDPVRSREIGSIVSLLQSDSPPHADPYATMKFSPPNIDMDPCSVNGTARMLPQLSIAHPSSYQPGSLAHQLAAPAMQPMMSPPAMYVDTQMSPDFTATERKHSGFLSAPVKVEPVPVTPTESNSRKGSVTKEDLIRMIMNMSPGEVDRLKSKEPKTRPSAVATRVTKEHDGSRGPVRKWADEDISDGDDIDDDDQPVRKGPKTERRTAHNLIEKKYRCSINDRIQHLKSMLAGDDAKLSKSATLRRAIEHIENLESENSALRTEIDRLTLLLRAHRIELPQRASSPMSMSPTASSGSLASPLSPNQSPPLLQKGAKRPRMDKSRLTMFAFMFAMIIFNPLSFFVSSASAHDSSIRSALPHGRVLDTDDEFGHNSGEWWQQNVVRPGFIWAINILVVIWVLTRLLVYGEPVQDFKSRSWSTFLSLRQRARSEAGSGNVREAMRQYMECLQVLERPLPSAGFDMLVSVIWQIVRHALNGLWIGRWFSRRRRDEGKPVTVVCKSHAHTALVYHKLHQLHLMGVDETYGGVSGLYLALSAVNLAESAGASTDGLPRSVMADIYIAAGIRTRLCLWSPFSNVISVYFFKRARRHIRRAEETSVNGLVWMYHPLARKFLGNNQLVESILKGKDSKLSPFIAESTDTPTIRLRAHFKLFLLSELAGELSGSLDHEVDVTDVSRLLLSISTSAGMPKKCNDWDCDTSMTEGDAMCTWWTHVLSCALFWKQSQNDRAKKAYTMVRQCPKELLANPLALAVGHAFCARKICFDDRENAKFGEFVFMHSKKALEILRTVVARSTAPETEEIHDVLCRLSYEWILTSLLDAWRQGLELNVPYWTQKSKLDYRTLYQEACNHYTFLDERSQHQAGFRATVYQLTCRMLNGANPLHTWTAVTKIRRQRLAAVTGHGQMDRSSQPDPFHLHVLGKLHADLTHLSERAK